MVKIPRKLGVAIACTCFLFVGGLAYGVSQIKFDAVKTELKTAVAPAQEITSVLFNEKLADDFIEFEYQFIVAEYYSFKEEYATAHGYYEKAVKSAKACLGERSFFTYVAYVGEAMSEERNGENQESNEHFKAALKALPELAEYDKSRWMIERWIIYTSDDLTAPKYIDFYRKHLALTEKLTAQIERKDLVYALSLLAKSLDNDDKKKESEYIWKQSIIEARKPDNPPKELVRQLLDFAYHEKHCGHKTEADNAIAEATVSVEKAKNDELMGDVLAMKGQFCLDSEEFDAAEKVFQSYLDLADKSSDDKNLHLQAFDWLAEVERRRGNLKKRAIYLENALEFADKPSQKFRRLPKLAIVARLDNHIDVARDCVKQWKLLPNNASKTTTFMYKKDMDDVLALYPKLLIGTLEQCKIGSPQVVGYHLSTTQLNTLMNAI